MRPRQEQAAQHEHRQCHRAIEQLNDGERHPEAVTGDGEGHGLAEHRRQPEVTGVGSDAPDFHQHQRDAERRDDDGIGRALGKRQEDGSGEQCRCERGIGEGSDDPERYRRRQGQPQNLPAEHRKQDEDLAGEGEQRPMRQIGAPQHAVGEDVAERQQRIERAGMQSVQQLLQEVVHAPPRYRDVSPEIAASILTCQSAFSG